MENEFLKRVYELRSDHTTHYNCAQSVLIPFAEACGISEQQAFALGAHFGGGMKMGSVCGAVTGGAMVLGLLGAADEQYQNFLQTLRQNHGGVVTCSEQMQILKETGGEQKPFCDSIIDDAIVILSRMIG